MPTPHELQPKILFEDQHLIVLSKPAGLLSQGERSGDLNLVDWLREYFKRNYVGLIHRLDRNTSGIMIIAKRTKSAQRLTQALQQGQIKRSYLAWLEGEIQGTQNWRHFLLKDERTNTSKVVRPGTPHAKEAMLRIQALLYEKGHDSDRTLVEFILDTGRSHQIRVQAATEGHPLVGDLKYRAKNTSLISRPALHSYHLKFPHPMSDDVLSFSAPLTEDFKKLSKSSLSDIDPLLMSCGSEMFGEVRPRG